MRGSNLIFDYVNILYYKCHRIDFKHGGLYIDSLDWTKKKKEKRKNQQQIQKMTMINVFNMQQQSP